MASSMYCSWRYMVSATMRAVAVSRRMRRMAATPSISGMTMSIRIRSGRAARANSTAWAPLAASATTQKPPIRSQRWRKPWRMRVWSSAIRILAMAHLIGGVGGRQQGDEQLRTLTDGAVDVQRAAQAEDPLAHLAQAEMSGMSGCADQAGVEAAAVVAERERHAARRIYGEMHPCRTRAGVVGDVVQALLDDAEQRQFVGRGQAVRRAGHLEAGAS